MFSRPSPDSEGTTPEGTTESPQAPRGEAERAFDQVLDELSPGPSAGPPDAAGAAASVTEHAATLRATRDAHQEAQAMLAVATEARKQASEEAERILLEARDAAERTRQEMAGWAAAQRAKVDALAGDMVESANRDAESIRTEALRTSLAEAEEVARQHVAEAAARAQQDADAIRGEARNVLDRAMELGEEANEAIADLTSTVSDIMTRLQGARASMAQLLAENPRPEPTAAADPDDDAGLDDAADEPGADGTADGEADAETDGETDGDNDLTDDAEDTADTEATDGPDDAGDDAGAADVADEPRADGDDRPATTDPDQPLDRQLGSMFRRHGHRGH